MLAYRHIAFFSFGFFSLLSTSEQAGSCLAMNCVTTCTACSATCARRRSENIPRCQHAPTNLRCSLNWRWCCKRMDVISNPLHCVSAVSLTKKKKGTKKKWRVFQSDERCHISRDLRRRTARTCGMALTTPRPRPSVSMRLRKKVNSFLPCGGLWHDEKAFWDIFTRPRFFNRGSSFAFICVAFPDSRRNLSPA